MIIPFFGAEEYLTAGDEAPSFDEAPRFAENGRLPASCRNAPETCAGKLGRSVGRSVAAHDHLVNVTGSLDAAVASDKEHFDDMTDAATRGGLTGLYVREVFDSWLHGRVSESDRYGGPLCLFMTDLDDFKRVNDEHGRQRGDEVLKIVGAILRGNLCASDFAARYGGEELAAALTGTDLHDSPTVAEKIRELFEAEFAHNLGLTISIGPACRASDVETGEELASRANQAMYQAKREGNRFVA